MICPSCKGSWDPPSGISITTCPFCQANLSPIVNADKADGSVQSLIVSITSQFSPKIYQDTQKFKSLLSDYFVGQPDTLRLLRLIVDNGGGKELYRISALSDKDFDVERRKLILALSNSTLVAPEKLEDGVNLLCVGLNKKVVATFTEPQPTPVSLPTTSPKSTIEAKPKPNPATESKSEPKPTKSATPTPSVKDMNQPEVPQKEHRANRKTPKAVSNIATLAILSLAVASYFFELSVVSDFTLKHIDVLNLSVPVNDVAIVSELTFVDGIKNGLLIFGRSFGDIFVNSFTGYMAGFDGELMENIIWGFGGLFWEPMKHFFLFFPQYLVSLVVAFFQTFSIPYFVGYIIGSGVPILTTKLISSDSDEID